MRQLAAAFRSYATAHDGILTGGEACGTPDWLFDVDPDSAGPTQPNGWDRVPYGGQLYPYYRDAALVLCPSDRKGNGKFSYSIPVNIRYRIMDEVENSTAALLIMEEHPVYYIGGILSPARREGGFACSDRPAGRHDGRTSLAYFDGHAALERYPEGTIARDFEIKPWGSPCGQDWPP
jgi:prepilin-type processing-associated H-X9-DG protein